MIAHLEPDILECEVKWALRSITTNKRRWWNSTWAISNPKRWCCESAALNASKFGKLSNGHRTGKGQFSLQPQRRAMPKNVQATVQLCSFHMLARLCSKSVKLGLSCTWNENLKMYRMGFEEEEETRDKTVNIPWIMEIEKEFQEKHLLHWLH